MSKVANLWSFRHCWLHHPSLLRECGDGTRRGWTAGHQLNSLMRFISGCRSRVSALRFLISPPTSGISLSRHLLQGSLDLGVRSRRRLSVAQLWRCVPLIDPAQGASFLASPSLLLFAFLKAGGVQTVPASRLGSVRLIGGAIHVPGSEPPLSVSESGA